MIINKKYIRTKDGIFEVKATPQSNAIYKGSHTYCIYDHIEMVDRDITEKDILEQADTIEELCDGFWWENTMYKEPIFIPNFGLALDRIKAWKESDKELDSHDFDRITIYGSIYIKGKGWKHGCKVNKESEKSELL